MRRILAGIETEYGLLIEGRAVESQVEDAIEFVRSYPRPAFAGWDYRQESPRADLRGFRLDRLAVDPDDARYDRHTTRRSDIETRTDRVLVNGARFYNDHGHPEYSTPECWSLRELALHDQAGELALRETAQAFREKTGMVARIYKNNTDFHGASYGTHESYLCPRGLGFQAIYDAVLPMLVVRQILCGAGKVGRESGPPCDFQLSQRADFMVEPCNAETLFRRPIFNTRDEPHADPRTSIRLHVISGDANRMASCTRRKAGLVKLALLLAEAGETPQWKLADPVAAFQSISRDSAYRFELPLERGSWTTAREIFESYFAAADQALDLRSDPESELAKLVSECRDLLVALEDCPERFRRSVDWAAKRHVLEQFIEEEQSDWSHPALQSLDLEYHNIDPDEGLFDALQMMEEVEPNDDEAEVAARLEEMFEPTRAQARAFAVSRFAQEIGTMSWSSISVAGEEEVFLNPDAEYPLERIQAEDVRQFVHNLQGIGS